MTENKFTELVNLYLDKEISEKELKELKAELASDSERQAEFQERCRFHQAMRLALNPDSGERDRSRTRRRASGKSAGGRSGRRRASSVRLASSRSASVSSSRIDERLEGAMRPASFPRWVLGAGLAASLLVALLLLPSVFRDTTHVAALPEFEGVDAEELMASDPLDAISRSDLRRYATIQEQRAANQRTSLAAQLRLMGLRPELTPQEKELRSVSFAALQPKAPRRSQAEVLKQVQALSPMPAPQILRIDSAPTDTGPKWPGGFQSSLASFK